jgi:protein AbiQ
MKENKKIKLRKLNFYIIDDNYINYLSQFEKHIAYNKNEKRPYIGVVIIVEEHYYFAPLFSPKPKHKNYKDNLSFFRILSKTKEDLGIIRFSDMIPVPQECVYLLDTKSKSYGYKRLLAEQYFYINQPQNKEKIIGKADKIYSLVIKENTKSKTALFYKQISCDFKLLEEQCKKYTKKENEN